MCVANQTECREETYSVQGTQGYAGRVPEPSHSNDSHRTVD